MIRTLTLCVRPLGDAHRHLLTQRWYCSLLSLELITAMTIDTRLPLVARHSRGLTAALAAVSLFAAISVSAATCPAGVAATTSTPTSDFVINGNGTATHTTTGLMWKVCNEGLTGTACSAGSATLQLWLDALSSAKNSVFAGYSDWRLPNKQELESLIDNQCYLPSINDTVFPGTVADFTWTSTTLAGDSAAAWFVGFGNGGTNADSKTEGFVGSSFAVRLVRGGQSFDALAAALPVLNIDDSDAATRYGPATDGVLLLRYLFGLRGAALTAGALGINPQRSAAQIEAHIFGNLAAFDVDGDSKVLATTDGLMILRRLLGLSGTALTAGVKNSARSDGDVAAAIDALKP